MFKLILRIILILAAEVSAIVALGQSKYSSAAVFAHNDYVGSFPFSSSYQQRVGFIEADIFLKGNELYVAHSRIEISSSRTLDALYLAPLAKEIKSNGGTAYPETDKTLTLMIDLKTDGLATIPVLVGKIEKYPEIISCKQLSITLSGSVPDADQWKSYPAYITFDGRPTKTYTAEQITRVRLVSDNFANYSKWKGEGELPQADREKLSKVLADTHALGKPFRFWATPDTNNAWTQLIDLKADVLNTDRPSDLIAFLNTK